MRPSVRQLPVPLFFSSVWGRHDQWLFLVVGGGAGLIHQPRVNQLPSRLSLGDERQAGGHPIDHRCRPGTGKVASHDGKKEIPW